MRIQAVKKKEDWRLFFDVTARIYANDPVYIPHLEQDIKKVLSAENPLYKLGGLKIWIAYDEKGVAGRIAAFYEMDKEIGGIGFFECTESQALANLLFSTAIEFLKKNKKSTVQGPINFGERDKYWGLMVSGFCHPGYQENYNPPYYQSLFEAYGFQKGIEQTTQELSPKTFNIQKFKPIAERIFANPTFQIRRIEKNNMRKYAQDFVEIYNKAWQKHRHFSPLNTTLVMNTMKSMKPILREDLIWFAYVNSQPIGFYVSLIDVNKIFKNLNGRFDWWGKLKFMWYRNAVKIDRIRGIVFGVIPEYQGRGVESSLIMKIFDVFEKDKNLRATELAWVGDFNPKMLGLLKHLGAQEIKVHITYEKKI